MKAAVKSVALLVAFAVVSAVVAAEGKKAEEKTLEGTITCAKCDLKLAPACATVIKVKEGDKDVLYYFDKAGEKKYHSDVCQEAKEGKVTGVVSKKGDKNMIKVSKVEYK